MRNNPKLTDYVLGSYDKKETLLLLILNNFSWTMESFSFNNLNFWYYIPQAIAISTIQNNWPNIDKKCQNSFYIIIFRSQSWNVLEKYQQWNLKRY